MFVGKRSTCLLLLGALWCLSIIVSERVASAQGEEEGQLPLKRGPRQGFEKEAPRKFAGGDDDDEYRDEDWEDDEEEEEEEEIEEQDWNLPAGGEKSLGKIEWSTPDLDDDYHSPHLPSDMKCDACTILTHLMTERLDRANQKRPSLKKKLPESDIIEIFEDICSDKFNNVGVKEINGKQRLSGPGSKIQEVPGIMQGGGKWPFRMLQMCEGYLGEFGEDELYDFYLDGTLKKKLCHGPRGVCRKKKEEKGKKKGQGKGKGKTGKKKTQKKKEKKAEL